MLVNGSTVAVGAPYNDNYGTKSLSNTLLYTVGHVRVFRNIDNQWVQVGKDIDGIGQQDHFGTSVSLSHDGNIIAIGGPQADGPNGEENGRGFSGQSSGHVRIFENINNSWSLVGSDIYGSRGGDHSGHSISSYSPSSKNISENLVFGSKSK